MKKILFLLLVLLIKLNAYEYRVFIYSAQDRYYYDTNNGFLRLKVVYKNSTAQPAIYSPSSGMFWDVLNGIHRQNTDAIYISKSHFLDILKNDSLFLNDFYLQAPQQILNFLYNNNDFNLNNHIQYEDYQILYNSDGLAVESIVNGKWAGLYDDSGLSGNLYNEKGDLIYVNGVSASFFEKINNRLLRKFKINLESIFIKNIYYPLLVLIFACVILRSVIRMAFQAFLIRFYDKKISQLEKRREKIENA